MLNLLFEQDRNKSFQILCLGAHSDDIEIGCGGTILKLIQTYPNLSFYWVVFGASEQRAFEAQASAELFLTHVGKKHICIKEFKDSFFPYSGAEIKLFFEELKQDFAPDLIFTHYRHDLHQDHRVISDLTWNTFRDHLILEYEIPKYDGDLGVPNVFMHLDEVACHRKVQLLLESFGTQRNKDWFSMDTFYALLRLRGMECKSPSKYAEAFYCRKMVLMKIEEQNQ